MNIHEYRSSDFIEAIVLRYHGHKILHVDKSEKRAVFHFEHSYDTDELLEKYRRRELLVEPQAFYLCEREIKDRLYN